MSERNIILEGIVGSTVHGVAVKDGLEDLDIMAVCIEPPEKAIGFYQEDAWVTRTKPEGVRSEAGDLDHTCYGLRKFLGLALKGNPSILLLLFVPESATRKITQEGIELRGLVPDIVSKQCYAPFRGYMRQQHERLLGLRGQRNVTRPELVEAYGYDTKYAAHIIRLGLQGEEILTSGRITLPMPEQQRQMIVKVRTGGFTLAQISEEIIGVENRIIAAHANSPLSESPNRKKVQAWMIDTYLRSWGGAERRSQSSE